MKNLTLTITLISASILISACDPQPRKTKPAHGGMRAPGDAPAETTQPKPPKTERKKETNVDLETGVTPHESVKPESKPVPLSSPNPEYGKKSEGKPGFIESPYSPGKLIDVRGLPPGTEIECPYTRRPLLVP